MSQLYSHEAQGKILSSKSLKSCFWETTLLDLWNPTVSSTTVGGGWEETGVFGSPDPGTSFSFNTPRSLNGISS